VLVLGLVWGLGLVLVWGLGLELALHWWRCALSEGLPQHRRSPKHDRRSPVLDLSEHRR